MLDAAARQRPDAEALVCDDDALDLPRLCRLRRRLSRIELQEAGIGAGARVALLMANSADIAIATFGVQAAGAQVVPLNPAYTASELAPMLADAAPALVVFDGAIALDGAAAARRGSARRRSRSAPPARRLTAGATGPRSPTGCRCPTRTASRPCSTPAARPAASKGVDITHARSPSTSSQREALLPTAPRRRARARRHAAVPCLRGLDGPVPRGQLRAARWSILAALPARGGARGDRARAHHAASPRSPTILVGLLACDGVRARRPLAPALCLSRARRRCRRRRCERWEAATGCPVVEGYGQSEAGPVLAYNPRDGVRKVGSVGIAAAAHRDRDRRSRDRATCVLPVGAKRRDPRARPAAHARLPQPARRDRGGAARRLALHRRHRRVRCRRLPHIRDRKKEMVIVGGYNVYPREVEEVLCTHPARARGGGGRRARCLSRRGAGRGGRGRRRGAAIDGEELLAHLGDAPRPLQGAASIRVCRRLAEDGGRQGRQGRLRDEVLARPTALMQRRGPERSA